jgi:hypothetical protein
MYHDEVPPEIIEAIAAAMDDECVIPNYDGALDLEARIDEALALDAAQRDYEQLRRQCFAEVQKQVLSPSLN